jgi:hypothetical protein
VHVGFYVCLAALTRVPEHSKATNIRSQFESQLQENTLVKQELALVKEGGKVFKLIGPTLVPQVCLGLPLVHWRVLYYM